MKTWVKVALHAVLIPSLVIGSYLAFKPRPVKLTPLDFGQDGKPKYSSMIRISSDKGICSAFVVSKNYALTAAHCVAGQLGEKFKVHAQNIVGEGAAVRAGTAIAARAVWYGGIDLGLLKGEFNDFNYAPIDREEVRMAPLFVSCGFGGGSLFGMCRPILLPQGAGFIMAAAGNLLPGMSGGPVINPFTGHVVGINSAQLDNVAFFTPTTRALEFLGLTGDEESQQ